MTVSSMLTFISDPAHGWLKVRLEELDFLGIRNKISGYSFLDTEYSYLEEDSDASIYLDARKEKGYAKPVFHFQHVNYFSRNKRRF